MRNETSDLAESFESKTPNFCSLVGPPIEMVK